MFPIILDSNNKVVAFGITMPSLSVAVQKSKGQVISFWIYPYSESNEE